jgi:hypothetical protein
MMLNNLCPNFRLAENGVRNNDGFGQITLRNLSVFPFLSRVIQLDSEVAEHLDTLSLSPVGQRSMAVIK